MVRAESDAEFGTEFEAEFGTEFEAEFGAEFDAEFGAEFDAEFGAESECGVIRRKFAAFLRIRLASWNDAFSSSINPNK